MATLADDKNRYDISRYLLAHGLTDAARDTLNRDSNAESAEFHLVQAQIALAAKDLPAAQKASQRALEIAPRDPRATLMAAEIALLRPESRDQALAILENGLRFSPADVDLNRKRLALLMQTDRWQAIDQALAGLRAALSEAGASSTEANLAAAYAFERRGQFTRAISSTKPRSRRILTTSACSWPWPRPRKKAAGSPPPLTPTMACSDGPRPTRKLAARWQESNTTRSSLR